MKVSIWILGMALCWHWYGCSHLITRENQKDCIDAIAHSIEAAPAVSFIVTLDGQKVDLEEFFEICDRNAPRCALYKKFPLWQNKVMMAQSPSNTGMATHRIRAYFSPSSICYPERVSPGRIYGDVAEVYDTNDEFMGIAVYMGEGVYFPLPFSRYSNRQGISIFPSISM